MRKIMVITGSRGEWGYIRPILKLIDAHDDLDYVLVVTNMHLLPSYGNSYKEIEADGFKIHYKINMSLDGYNHYTHSKSLGLVLLQLPDIIEVEKPDWILLAGDRGEQLSAAIAAAYTYTPVAHIQAGEVSGNIDGMARHAIGKLVHLHFASNVDAEQRLLKLGEEGFRVFNVGAPQIDEMVNAEYTDIAQLERELCVELSGEYILAVMHPVTEEMSKASEQAEIFIKALNHFDIPKVMILPNNDAGYLGLLKNCKCIVGNSSSGLLEAPTFKIPAVNIGRRQNQRFRGINVIDVEFDIEKIVFSIKKAMSDEFNIYLKKNCVNPYGDGNSSAKILEILLNTKIDDKLLIKNLTF